MKAYSKIMVLTLFVLVLIALGIHALPTSPPAHAAGPWYVGPGGNNSNNCLSRHPPGGQHCRLRQQPASDHC